MMSSSSYSEEDTSSLHSHSSRSRSTPHNEADSSQELDEASNNAQQQQEHTEHQEHESDEHQTQNEEPKEELQKKRTKSSNKREEKEQSPSKRSNMLPPVLKNDLNLQKHLSRQQTKILQNASMLRAGPLNTGGSLKQGAFGVSLAHSSILGSQRTEKASVLDWIFLSVLALAWAVHELTDAAPYSFLPMLLTDLEPWKSSLVFSISYFTSFVAVIVLGIAQVYVAISTRAQLAIFGLALFVAAGGECLMYLGYNDFGFLLAGRVIIGLQRFLRATLTEQNAGCMTCFKTVFALSLVVDLFSPEQISLAIGILFTASTVGSNLGPWEGGALRELSFLINAALSALCGVLFVLIVLIILRDKSHPFNRGYEDNELQRRARKKLKLAEQRWSLLGDAFVAVVLSTELWMVFCQGLDDISVSLFLSKGCALTSTTLSFTNSSGSGVTSFGESGVCITASRIAIGGVHAGGALAFSAAALLVGRFLHRPRSLRICTVCAIAGIAIGKAVTLSVESFWVVAVGMFISNAATGTLTTAAYQILVVSYGERYPTAINGLVLLYNCVIYLGYAIGVFIGPVLSNIDLTLSYYVIAAVTLPLIPLTWFLTAKTRNYAAVNCGACSRFHKPRRFANTQKKNVLAQLSEFE